MSAIIAVLLLTTDAGPNVPFDSPKYGVKVDLPKAWEIAQREQEDRVFVALVPQADPLRPGVVACELGLAPETLDDYRTRIDGNAARADRDDRARTPIPGITVRER